MKNKDEKIVTPVVENNDIAEVEVTETNEETVTETPKKEKEFSWYVYLILAVSCFLMFYTIFFYLFCFVI